ncbi:MAG TPA: serine hydrolase domain-containing protein [Myxococcota bacterium]|nr:serine hydrolase domain-containing protein [Myxococcota bacterium]
MPSATVAELLATAASEGVATDLDLVVLQGDAVVLEHRVGGASAWDLASLTKVLVGAPLSCAAIDAGELCFGSRVCDVLPGIDPRVSVAQLLSHSSGLPAWLPLYETASSRAEVLSQARTTPLEAVPGERHRYSDIGFLVLCALLEELGGARVDTLVGPLEGLSWGHVAAAPTERCPVRGCVVRGEVHDLNCAAMEGVSTHAGLFGDALAVARLGRGQLLRSREDSAIAWAWRHRGAGSHVLGWDGRSEPSSSGAFFPPDAVGHLGFTGTSLWIAPSQDVVVVLLTNRVHPSVEDLRIRSLRPAVHDAVVSDLRSRGLWVG